jgi:uncharacterized membrane protein
MHHSKQRYLFIDLLRFIAVVFMIQGHTFDALLDVNLHSHVLFFAHDFFHGFIAPMFLFASGIAFGISTFKKWEEHTTPTKHVARRYGKYAGLIVIGYALHLPYFSLQKILAEATEAEIAGWLQVDALHCIAATMLILQTAVFLLKDEKRFVWFASIVAVGIIFLSPIMWSMNLTRTFPLWFVSYINSNNLSWFPIFPWSAYILCGVIFSSFFINAKEHHHAVALMQKSIVIGLVMFFGSFILLSLPTQLYPYHDIWKVNPLIIFVRLGFVAIVTSGIFFAEHSYKIRPRIPQLIGRESLVIYVLHLIILYGSVMNQGLQEKIHQTLSVVEASFAFVIIFLVLSVVVFGWNYLKKNFRIAALAGFWSAAGIFLYYFLTRPY